MNTQLRRRIIGFWVLLCVLCVTFLALRSPSSLLLPIWRGQNLSAAEPRPNAAIVMLVQPSRITQAMMALLNIEDRFNRRLKYPYVLLTEANITEDIQSKVDWITEGRATLANLPEDMWGPPDYLNKDLIDKSIKSIGFSFGYRSMCRFFSGFFWRHPVIAHYDWIWRLDSDIQFHCDIPYDPFVRMRSAQALYAFVQITGDALTVQQSLASNVSEFLSTHSHLVPPGVNLPFSWKNVSKALEGNAENGDWAGRVFYDNWEISHRSVWTSEIYSSFFEYLDRAGGFFYERWGDAPVHSYGISMALRPDQVIQFNDMGYQHKDWPYECPAVANCACIRDSASEHFNSRGYQWFNASRP